MNRNRLIGASILIAALGIVLITGVILLMITREPKKPTELDQKKPAVDLIYCNSTNVLPCIVSIGLDDDGNMLINLRVPKSFPDFYMKIIRSQGEIRYECQMVEDFPTSFYCIGENVPPGEVPQFALVASDDNTLLAQGSLPIIGLAFPTIGIAMGTPSPMNTQEPGQGTTVASPTSSNTTPRPSTPTKPSYPNPTPVRTRTPSYP